MGLGGDAADFTVGETGAERAFANGAGFAGRHARSCLATDWPSLNPLTHTHGALLPRRLPQSTVGRRVGRLYSGRTLVTEEV